MPTVHDVLAVKGFHVHTVRKDTSVLAATQQMNKAKIGALVVVDSEKRVVGMFTERDVLRRIVAEQRDPASNPVEAVMTRNVVCCHEDDMLDEVRSIMAQRRVRHLPVLDNEDSLIGLVSIGDLNAWCLHDGEVKIAYMESYLYGRG